MRIPSLSIFLVLPLLIVPAPAAAQPSAVLARVDSLRLDGAFEQARDTLQALQNRHPDRAPVLWRLARTYVDLGEEAEDDRQEELYQQAFTAARAAVEADSANAEAHLAVAIAAGRMALISGTRTKVELSRTVKEHVDRAIEIDPTNATAHHVRGKWHHEVASLGFFARTVVKVVYGGLPDASYDRAVRDFQTAVDLDEHVGTHLELGRTYLQMDRDEDARQHLERALELPNVDPDDPRYKREARELLRDLR